MNNRTVSFRVPGGPAKSRHVEHRICGADANPYLAAATAAQRDLLLQVVDVVMPEDARATVGDGLRHVLKRSGYRLCEPTPAIAGLYALPLPAAHLHLGPLTLRDALLTLAGPAWDVNVDDRARQVCFSRPGEAPDSPAADDAAVAPVTAPASGAAKTFPLTSGEQP